MNLVWKDGKVSSTVSDSSEQSSDSVEETSATGADEDSVQSGFSDLTNIVSSSSDGYSAEDRMDSPRDSELSSDREEGPRDIEASTSVTLLSETTDHETVGSMFVHIVPDSFSPDDASLMETEGSSGIEETVKLDVAVVESNEHEDESITESASATIAEQVVAIVSMSSEVPSTTIASTELIDVQVETIPVSVEVAASDNQSAPIELHPNFMGSVVDIAHVPSSIPAPGSFAAAYAAAAAGSRRMLFPVPRQYATAEYARHSIGSRRGLPALNDLSFSETVFDNEVMSLSEDMKAKKRRFSKGASFQIGSVVFIPEQRRGGVITEEKNGGWKYVKFDGASLMNDKSPGKSKGKWCRAGEMVLDCNPPEPSNLPNEVPEVVKHTHIPDVRITTSEVWQQTPAGSLPSCTPFSVPDDFLAAFDNVQEYWE